jgi:hypothetical protein
LVIRTTTALYVTVRHVATEIARPIHAVTRTSIELPPRLCLACCGGHTLLVFLNPSLLINKPVTHELLGILLFVTEVALCQSTSSDLNFANLTNLALALFLLAVDYQ